MIAGLCASCRHARRLLSASGSEFVQCRLAERDPRYDKWPRQPVLACAGHERGAGGEAA